MACGFSCRQGWVVVMAAALVAVTGALVGLFAQPAAEPRRPLVEPFLNMPPNLPLRPGQWMTVPAFPNLRFNVPTALVQAPRSDRLYVCERDGVIRSFVNDPNASAATVVLDLSRQCQGVSDCGLLSLAFHPDFGKPGLPNRGYFYVFYNYADQPVRLPQRPQENMKTWDRLSRFTIPDGELTADPKSELVLIHQEDEQLFHTGGPMFFHPDDGFLYLAIGDEGAGAGRLGNCQRIDKDLFAGVLRIDVDCDPVRSHPPRRQPQNGKTGHYFIPKDNPFVGLPNVLEEFWAIGLRSPHRMTFDPVTKRIWLGDVGDGGLEPREEINLIERGGNYQWNYREGAVETSFAPKPAKILGHEIPPLHEYRHNDGNRCVIGGYVYRGRTHAAFLGGKYVFGDYGSGRVWALTAGDGKPPVVEELCILPPKARQLTTFGVDATGEFYLCEHTSGQIHKLAKYGSDAAPLRPPHPLPRLLSQTGAFRDTATLTAAEGLLPYEVNAPLFSDNTVKRRWIALPNPGPRINFTTTGEWKFPAGTVFVKHFELGINDRNPEARTRLETRFLVRDPDGSVYGVTYKWRPDQRDAELLEDGAGENLTIPLNNIGIFTGVDIGNPEQPGKSMSTDVINAIGTPWARLFAPLARHSDNEDCFHFYQQQRTGGFDVTVQIDGPRALQAGLLVSETLAPDSRHVGILLGPNDSSVAGTRTARFRKRTTRDRPWEIVPTPSERCFSTGWLRLQRVGNRFTAFTSPDGIRWAPAGTAELALPEKVYLGVAVIATTSTPAVPVAIHHLSNVREQRWQYPSRNDCLTCHNANAKFVLGVNARQLNGYSQLEDWSRLGMFDRIVTDTDIAGCAKLVDLAVRWGKLEDRVRSYLDANCAFCHRPNGAPGYFDARFETPLDKQNIIDGAVIADLGVDNARVIAPKDDGRSILYERMKRCDKLMMPPLGRTMRDSAAVRAVREWISSLPVKPPKKRLGKRLAALSGCFVLALSLGVGMRRWLNGPGGGGGLLVRSSPLLASLVVLATGFVICLARLERNGESVILSAVAAAFAAALVMLFARGALRGADRRQTVRAAAETTERSSENEQNSRRRAA